jgi:hypothetical protein
MRVNYFYQITLESLVPTDHLVQLSPLAMLGQTAVTASTAAADDTSAVPELLDKHRESLDEIPRRAVADSAYDSHDCHAYIQDKGIEKVIKKRSGGNKYGGYDKENFVYDAAADIFVCPAGFELKRTHTDRKKKKAHYRCDVGRRGSCVQRVTCMGEKSTAKARVVTRFDTPCDARAQAACQSSIGRKLLKLRHTMLEGLFGQAKNYHGLGRARWRGLGNMTIQSLVIATVLNLKKLLAYSSKAAAATVAVCAKPIFDIIRQICHPCMAILRLMPTENSKTFYLAQTGSFQG